MHIRQEDIIVKKSDKSRNIFEFKSYEKDLVDFLREDAFDNQEKNISLTYLFIDKRNNLIAGYLTVLADSISLNTQLKEEFRSRNIKYKSLPAMKIGRICVDDRYLRQGLGRSIMLFTYKLVYRINKIAGCRFITLDSKNDSLHFYKRFGFEVLRKRNKGSIPMYKDVSKLIQELNMQFQTGVHLFP